MTIKFVPRFDSIVGQKQPLRILTTYLRNEAIPHALLFTGIEGVGKKTAAMIFSMACNCSDKVILPVYWTDKLRALPDKNQKIINPCGECRSCKKIISGNHPDIIHIKPPGPYIRIAQIRSLIQTLAMKPYEAWFRVVVLSDAQTMNPEASNALLKVLEEPPPQTILILTALQATDLLPTVTSRCQLVKFNPIPCKDLTEMLMEKHDIDPERAEIIAIMANGSYSKAFSMIGSDWLLNREWLLNASGLYHPEKLSSRSTFEQLAFADCLAHNKKTILDSMEVLKLWLRDLVVFKYSPEKIINKDLISKIKQASEQVSLESLLSKISLIQSAQKAIQSNANLRLTLETMMLGLLNPN